MDNEKNVTETVNVTEQTLAGKILGWIFGVLFTLFVFLIFDKEVGAFSFAMTIIGVLLLPPVNMKLRGKYQDFVIAHHGDKYSINLINFAYAIVKLALSLLLIVCCSIITVKSNVSYLSDSTTQKATVSNEKNDVQPAPEAKSELQEQPKPQPEQKVSREFKNALRKAEIYSDTMYMSKKAIYEQLTSDYGEQFPADAAQYAVDNLKANYEKNALEKAKTYQNSMSMSKKAIYDQLISEYGEKFTAKEAQYAIDHLED